MNGDEIFQKNVSILSEVSDEETRIMPKGDAPLPSVDALRSIVEWVKMIVFPGFFDRRQADNTIRSYHMGVNMERLYQALRQQITLALAFCDRDKGQSNTTDARDLSMRFIDRLPEIKRMLYTDVAAIYDDDPATDSYGEVIFCYPVVQAMIHYRIAHELLLEGIPVIPRIITELAHSATGIDIHPGARIGEYFSIDHGTGIVIGETSIIGNHVTLYQGVTLGARNYKLTGKGHPADIPRHPIIEDNVTIYSNSTLLGRITIGHDTVIGGNIWVTHDVPPYSHLLQGKAIDAPFTDGLGI